MLGALFDIVNAGVKSRVGVTVVAALPRRQEAKRRARCQAIQARAELVPSFYRTQNRTAGRSKTKAFIVSALVCLKRPKKDGCRKSSSVVAPSHAPWLLLCSADPTQTELTPFDRTLARGPGFTQGLRNEESLGLSIGRKAIILNSLVRIDALRRAGGRKPRRPRKSLLWFARSGWGCLGCR